MMEAQKQARSEETELPPGAVKPNPGFASNPNAIRKP